MRNSSADIYDSEYVRSLFNKMSASYERINFITSFGFSIRWRHQFLQSIKTSKNNLQIADLLTGMGETWRILKYRFPDAEITALDFSDEMIKHAAANNHKYFSGSINIVQEDVLCNSLPDNYFDVVTCAFGLKTFNNEQLFDLAIQVKRILKPGGTFSFIEISEPTNPLLKILYGFYLRKVIPVLGWLLLGNPSDYKMLWKYTSQFKNAKAATEIFRSVGLTTEFKSYFGNCASGICGCKL